MSIVEYITIPLTRGKVATVDKVDADLAEARWHVDITHNLPYACRNSKTQSGYKIVRMHRIIMERVLGRALLKTEIVDHIDGNSINNCRLNLRLATISENNRNAKLRKDSSSGYKGVSYNKQRKKWGASINIDSKTIFLGLFSTAEEAYRVYCEAAREYHGDFARFE
jgi:hypothetical protein